MFTSFIQSFYNINSTHRLTMNFEIVSLIAIKNKKYVEIIKY